DADTGNGRTLLDEAPARAGSSPSGRGSAYSRLRRGCAGFRSLLGPGRRRLREGDGRQDHKHGRTQKR
ncbi:MAG: hypothetical protein WCI21_03795, partial [Alphaproteobacteria bacterium]